ACPRVKGPCIRERRQTRPLVSADLSAKLPANQRSAARSSRGSRRPPQTTRSGSLRYFPPIRRARELTTYRSREADISRPRSKTPQAETTEAHPAVRRVCP